MAWSILVLDVNAPSEKMPPWWPNRLRATGYYGANIEVQKKVDSPITLFKYVLVNH
jgi:hypothetical protein